MANRQQRRAQNKAKPAHHSQAKTAAMGAAMVAHGWESYRDDVMPREAATVQMLETKRAVFGGLAIGLAILKAISENEDMSEDELAEVLAWVDREVLAQIARAGRADELTQSDLEHVRAEERPQHFISEDRTAGLAPGMLPQQCSVKDCDGESAYQVGATFKLGNGAMAESWVGLTECEAHKGYTTAERLFPSDQFPGWLQIVAAAEHAGAGRPKFDSVEIRRRGL